MNNKKFGAFIIIVFIALVMAACSPKSGQYPDSFAETVFEAYLPEPLKENETIYLEILDSLTGIALNPSRYQLESRDELTYFIRIPIAVNSLIKYRFVKSGDKNEIEVGSNGSQVHYRLYKIETASIASNLIAGWNAETYIQGYGELSGYIFDIKSSAPLAEVFVHMNGMRTLTSQNGFFQFENIPAGEFTLTALHPEGKYLPFQQKAVVAANAVTPASFGMQSAEFVNVRFVVTPPENTIKGSPIRILIDLYQFGDMYQEMNGGGSFIPSRSPILESQKDGTYQTTLSLPAGINLNYKYSLGDGFVNAEHLLNGEIRNRAIQVPSKDVTIKDTIESWHGGEERTMTFNISLPEETPNSDILSIQFNPFSWMEEISLWQKSGNQWIYELYGPFEFLEGAQYRFCRNEQCGTADDSVTAGENPIGYSISFENQKNLSLSYDLLEWNEIVKLPYQVENNIPASQVYLSKNGFDLSSKYDPHWNSYWKNGLIAAGVSGADWIIFSPSWTFENSGSHDVGLIPGQDPLMFDINQLGQDVNDGGMQFSLFPRPNFVPNAYDYWMQSPLSYNWWLNWFEDYRRFILNYANYAELHGIPNLIIAGESITPAIPGGAMPNGGFSNLPAEFKQSWIDLIMEIRTVYQGSLEFALPYGMEADQISEILRNVDGIYLEFSPSITSETQPTLSTLETRLAKIIDEELYELYALTEKPIQIAIDYPSVDGAASNCIDQGFTCERLFESGNQDYIVDTLEQADIYQAILRVVVQRPWINGIFSKGFNPTVAVNDASNSIHGKPAMDVVSFYFRNSN